MTTYRYTSDTSTLAQDSARQHLAWLTAQYREALAANNASEARALLIRINAWYDAQ